MIRLLWMIHYYFLFYSLGHPPVLGWSNEFLASRKLRRRSNRPFFSGRSELFDQTNTVVNGDEFRSPTTESPSISKSNVAFVTDPGQERVYIPPVDRNMFDLLVHRAADCLYQSDLRRDAIGKAAGKQASSATNWIHDESAFSLQKTLDQLCLDVPSSTKSIDSDIGIQTLRWFRSIPCPVVLDLSHDIQSNVNDVLTDAMLQQISQKRPDFLARLGCRLILFPSGTPLPSPLTEPPASIVYGQLLYGGVTRFRLLGNQRKAGERTEVKPTTADRVPTWMMYGGPDRLYESVDMGAAAIFEVLLLPRGQSMQRSVQIGQTMQMSGVQWKPQSMFQFAQQPLPNSGADFSPMGQISSAVSLSGRDLNEAFRREFQLTVGGLQLQIDAIVRRVLDGRVIRPVTDDHFSDNSTEFRAELATKIEAEELELLGLTPVRGLLLYGPPGCGKTALAREISRALRARTPKIVSAPELLDRWVGGSEKLVRALFADAEAELAACNNDATKSALHVIVIDEIDAVFRKRSSSEDSGEATRSSVVNQILSKLDGVKAISNVLLIGMTNRKELLDDALLRPGRLEVQIEIPLPNKEGRREILDIHFNALRKRGRLSHPLCCAIDGVPLTIQPSANQRINEDGSFDETVEKSLLPETSNDYRSRSPHWIKQVIHRTVRPLGLGTFDLAAESVTGGFSGAEIAGLVRCAGSLALSRARNDGYGIDGLVITLDDVKLALKEVRR